MTILHSSKEQKQKPECLPSVVLNLLTLEFWNQTEAQDLCLAIALLSTQWIFQKIWLELILPSRLRRGESTEQKAADSESNQTSLQRRCWVSFEMFWLQNRHDTLLFLILYLDTFDTFWYQDNDVQVLHLSAMWRYFTWVFPFYATLNFSSTAFQHL